MLGHIKTCDTKGCIVYVFYVYLCTCSTWGQTSPKKNLFLYEDQTCFLQVFSLIYIQNPKELFGPWFNVPIGSKCHVQPLAKQRQKKRKKENDDNNIFCIKIKHAAYQVSFSEIHHSTWILSMLALISPGSNVPIGTNLLVQHGEGHMMYVYLSLLTSRRLPTSTL